MRKFVKGIIQKSSMLRFVHANIRGTLQDRRAARSLAQHKALAIPDGHADDPGKLQTKLRERIRRRKPNLVSKKLGDLHVFVAYQVWDWEAILPIALQPFGKVSSYDFHGDGFDENLPDWPSRQTEMNRRMLDRFMQANEIQPVDAVVCYLSGHNTHPDVLQEMGRQGAAIFNFCWDDKLNFPGEKRYGIYRSPAGIANAVDLNLTNAPESVIKYAAHGGLALFWPEAAHPDVHKPVDVPFEHDVSFVGARYGWRPALIQQLEKLGVSATCFGRGWPNGPLPDSDMISIFSKSRINLGFSTIGYSKTLMCLKGRDFEIPMSGALYLTQHNPELEIVFDVGKEILTYRNAKECASLIRHYLAHPDEAASIRTAARERCLRDHTYLARWSQVFRLAGILN